MHGTKILEEADRAIDTLNTKAQEACADPSDRAGFTRFYLRVWLLFFLEYAIVPVSCLAG